MKKSMILLGFLALAPFAKGQLLLEALEGGASFTPSEKCLERVKDKHYGDGVHNYIYCAVQGPNGKKWLNLNLGAEYAKESSPHFNPEALPTDYNDWKAFGNLYQWGRGSDGHEQVEYRQESEFWEFRPINGVRSTRLAEGEQSNQMVADPSSNVYAHNLGNTWTNDPCPNGYHIATVEDIKGLGKLDKIRGTMGTTSVFGSSVYPNLELVTSPTLILTFLRSGWQSSDTGTKSLGWTSSMWLSGGPSNQYDYSDGVWKSIKNPRSAEPIVILDRGVGYFDSQYNYEEYEYGIQTDSIMNQNTKSVIFLMATRCVEN